MSVLFGGHAAQNEREARGLQLFRAGIQGPNVAAPPQVGRILVTQEQPGHPVPRSSFYPGVQGPNVRVPVFDRLFTTQQLPTDHPAPTFRPGVQGPNVASPPQIAQRILITQEQPFHPRSQFWPAPPPVKAQLPFMRPLLTTQQLPDHPRSIFHTGTPPVSYEDVQVFIIL